MSDKTMKLVGITCSPSADTGKLSLEPRYVKFLLDTAEKVGVGVLPVVLPPVCNPDILREYVARLDGFFFTGGVDIDPARYGDVKRECCGEICELRDEHELTLLKFVREADRPAFGICRGIQTMAVAAGCTLWQDIGSEALSGAAHCEKDENDKPRHPVQLSGWLAEAAGERDVITNSYHHQAVHDVADGIEIAAVAHDGIIEGIVDTTKRYYRAVQWHPEMDPDELSYKVFRTFIEAL